MRNVEIKTLYNENLYNLDIWECGGDEEFKDVRSIPYKDTNVFIVCFAYEHFY